MKRHTKILSLVVLFSAIVLGMWRCNYPQSPASQNSLPTTRLANIPANDTIAKYIGLGVIPEVTLYWLGDDPDGYVVAYRYRWTDFYRGQQTVQPYTTVLNIVSIGSTALQRVMLVKAPPQSVPNIYRFFTTLTNEDQDLINAIGDSIATQRAFAVPYKSGVVPGDSVAGADSVVHASPTTGRFIFESPADSNMHRFEVSSVDNSGGVDPNPATVNFWTLRSPAPIATITPYVVGTQTSRGFFDSVAIRYPTDRWPGLRFDYSAIDPSTDELVFAWAVDDTSSASWSPWSENRFAYITASDFKPVATGTHIIHVRAKNRWGVLSNTASAPFYAFVPALDNPGFSKRILILNADVLGNGTVGKPDSNQVKAAYAAVMDSLGKSGDYDIHTVSSAGGADIFASPLRAIRSLGNYSTVLFLYEQKVPAFGPGVSNIRFDPNKQQALQRYFDIGGKLIFSGPVDTASINNFSTSLYKTIFHIFPFSRVRQNNNLDFIGTNGLRGYPNIRIDPNKVAPSDSASLRYVPENVPAGFAETIGLFVSRTNDAQWVNAPIGIRFLAPPPIPPARQTFSVVHFGFPLYYAYTSDIVGALRVAFSDLNE